MIKLKFRFQYSSDTICHSSFLTPRGTFRPLVTALLPVQAATQSAHRYSDQSHQYVEADVNIQTSPLPAVQTAGHRWTLGEINHSTGGLAIFQSSKQNTTISQQHRHNREIKKESNSSLHLCRTGPSLVFSQRYQLFGRSSLSCNFKQNKVLQ